RVERRRKAILNVVSYRDGIFEIAAGDDRHDGAEDFLLGDAHLGIDIDEHRRLHEPAVLIFAFVEAVTAADHSRAFVSADSDLLRSSQSAIWPAPRGFPSEAHRSANQIRSRC